MLAAATEVNLRALRARAPESPALAKYVRVGRLLSGNESLDDSAAADALVGTLQQWPERLELPRLSTYGIGPVDIPAIVAASRNNSMKSNPILLSDDEVGAIVRARL